MKQPPKELLKKKITPEDTLRLLSQVNPPEGLSGRIEARLASTRISEPEPEKRKWWQLSFLTAFPRTAVASLLVCAVIGGGIGLYRSHRSSMLPPPIRLNSGGMGAAGAVRVAPAGIVAPEGTSPRLAPKNSRGRAVIPEGHKPRPKGVAVPNTPPPSDKDSGQEK